MEADWKSKGFIERWKRISKDNGENVIKTHYICVKLEKNV